MSEEGNSTGNVDTGWEGGRGLGVRGDKERKEKERRERMELF